MIRTFRPWTHTSDDSYIFQLSLGVATATTVSFLSIIVDVLVHGVQPEVQSATCCTRAVRLR